MEKNNCLEPVRYFLEPGYLYLSDYPALISTVLGSCVSVCLWDCKNMIGGMNHFILPRVGERDKPTTRFGNVSVPLLIKMMIDDGACLKDIQAQIFGGANPVKNIMMRVGEGNVNLAREILKRYNIRVVSEDVEGNLGRKIVFNTFTGEAIVLKVKELRKTDWRPQV